MTGFLKRKPPVQRRASKMSEIMDRTGDPVLSRRGHTTPFTDDFWNARHTCTTVDSNGRVSVVAACRSAGHWFDGDGHGDRFAAPAMTISVAALRTGIDPNVQAGADLARRVPAAVCIRFAARATVPPAMA